MGHIIKQNLALKLLKYYKNMLIDIVAWIVKGYSSSRQSFTKVFKSESKAVPVLDSAPHSEDVWGVEILLQEF
jgi:hypothetical protein